MSVVVALTGQWRNKGGKKGGREDQSQEARDAGIGGGDDSGEWRRRTLERGLWGKGGLPET
jgi:hypothetical protein